MKKPGQIHLYIIGAGLLICLAALFANSEFLSFTALAILSAIGVLLFLLDM